MRSLSHDQLWEKPVHVLSISNVYTRKKIKFVDVDFTWKELNWRTDLNEESFIKEYELVQVSNVPF